MRLQLRRRLSRELTYFLLGVLDPFRAPWAETSSLPEQLVAHLKEIVSRVTVDRQTLEQTVAHAFASFARVRVDRNDLVYLVSRFLDFTAFGRSRLTHNRRRCGHVETVRDWSRHI